VLALNVAEVDDGQVAVAARFAWAIPAAFLCLMLPARIGVAYALGTGVAGAVMAAALFVLPLLFTIPWGRAIWARYTWWLLGVQAVLTYLPFVMFGRLWAVGLSGLLGGLLLLTLPALATALFDAYFRDGLNVADHTQLTELAERVGLDGRRVRDFLATEDGGWRST
jgi:hypothetical protein